ncbi:MAG: NfeD family protein [Eubacterium sp.]|nr:NfeD family protein [Eubacterium sp.]
MPENLILTVWIALIVIFSVFEAVTAQLVSVWFVIGSIAALVAHILNAPLYLQIIIFIVVSIVALAITRPLVKKYIHPKKQSTNADRVIGQIGIVTEKIDNLNAVGNVKVDGKIWSARSTNGEIIPPDARIEVTEISGVKLIVKPINK